MQTFQKVSDTLPKMSSKEEPKIEPVTSEDVFLPQKVEVISEPPKLERSEAVDLDKVGPGKRGKDKQKRKKRTMSEEALAKLALARQKALKVRKERAAERKRKKKEKAAEKANLKSSPVSATAPAAAPAAAPVSKPVPVQKQEVTVAPTMSRFNDDDYDDYVLFKSFQRRKRARKARAKQPQQKSTPSRAAVNAQTRRHTPSRTPAKAARSSVQQIVTGNSSQQPVNPWAGCFNYK